MVYANDFISQFLYIERVYLKSHRKYDEYSSEIIETDKSDIANILSHHRTFSILRDHKKKNSNGNIAKEDMRVQTSYSILIYNCKKL